MDSFDLDSLLESDESAAEMAQRGELIAKFYGALVEGSLPSALAGTIVVDWARSMVQADGPPCGCDCDDCRGEVS